MLTGNPPLHQTPGIEMLEQLKDDGYNPLHQVSFEDYGKMSESAKDFITQCCHYDPKQRPTPTQLKKHPFIAKSKGRKSPLYDICDKMAPLVKADHFAGQ